MESIHDIAALCEHHPIVYLGEVHGHKETHQIETELVKQLTLSRHRWAICFEQFDRDVQHILGEYCAVSLHVMDTSRAKLR